MVTIEKDNGYPQPLSEKDKACFEAIYSYVNNGGISPLKVGEKLTDIHRALHGSILKLFIGWCREMAINHYAGKYDTRNRMVSKQVADIYDNMIEQGIVKDPNYIADTLKKQ
ncbi:MAG: hypothetical protein HDS35_09865 [Bacteroides sp.]|nr:hypothetical protein [Bacteroides sp.]